MKTRISQCLVIRKKNSDRELSKRRKYSIQGRANININT